MCSLRWDLLDFCCLSHSGGLFLEHFSQDLRSFCPKKCVPNATKQVLNNLSNQKKLLRQATGDKLRQQVTLPKERSNKKTLSNLKKYETFVG